jgi:AraC-like DNA-binding protein
MQVAGDGAAGSRHGHPGAKVEVSSLFSAKAIAQVAPHAAEQALAHAGLTRAMLSDPARRLAVEQHHALFDALAEGERPDIAFHMRTSASMACEDFGTVGLTMRSAPTLRRAIERLDRYARLFNPYSLFAFSEDENEGWWTNTRPAASDGARLSNEAALGTFVALWRDANGANLAPVRVQFMHPPVGSVTALEAHFRCPVSHGAEIDAIILHRADLDRPNRVGDRHIWDFLRNHLEESLGTTGNDQIDREVVIHVANTLSEGVPRLEDVARHLGIGGRTLQRRLSELGHSYQSLVDEARREVALRLVAEGRHSLIEIAFLTGFAEQSSFTRAFKRWSGKTPRAFRTDAPQMRPGILAQTGRSTRSQA